MWSFPPPTVCWIATASPPKAFDHILERLTWLNFSQKKPKEETSGLDRGNKSKLIILLEILKILPGFMSSDEKWPSAPAWKGFLLGGIAPSRFAGPNTVASWRIAGSFDGKCPTSTAKRCKERHFLIIWLKNLEFLTEEKDQTTTCRHAPKALNFQVQVAEAAVWSMESSEACIWSIEASSHPDAEQFPTAWRLLQKRGRSRSNGIHTWRVKIPTGLAWFDSSFSWGTTIHNGEPMIQ